MELAVKNPAANTGNIMGCGFDPWVGKIPGGGHGSPLQYSCLENPMDRGAWQALVHGAAESGTTEPKQLTLSHSRPKVACLHHLQDFLPWVHPSNHSLQAPTPGNQASGERPGRPLIAHRGLPTILRWGTKGSGGPRSEPGRPPRFPPCPQALP